MKLKIKTLLIISLSILVTMKASAETYNDQENGLKFDTGQLVLSESSPASMIAKFYIGKKYFAKTVKYRVENENLALDDFIHNQKKNDHVKSNTNLITYSPIHLADFDAYEIKIENRMSDNYWLVFQKKGDKRIFSFFLMADKKFSTINETAISSYQSMKSSLKVLQGSAPTDIHLSDKVQIEDALKLHKIMKKVSKSVTSCVDSGNEHSTCMCKNKIVINELKVSVNSIFIKYPSWLSARTLNFNIPNHKNVVFHPSALNTHLSKEISCSK